MTTQIEQKSKYGWLVLGVLVGAMTGDLIAVTLWIEPGYVQSVLSAPVLLNGRLAGAFAGFVFALVVDRWAKKGPNDLLWAACLWLYVLDLWLRGGIILL